MMTEMIKKSFRILNKEGLSGIKNRIQPPKIDIAADFEFVTKTETTPFSREDYLLHRKDQVPLLNWIIPEVGIGLGGHTTIFRFVSYLEQHGFHSRIYIFRGYKFQDDASLAAFLRTYFPILDEKVEVFHHTDRIQYAHAVVATSWETAYFVRNFNNAVSKFYFVQDFEPSFFPMGSEYMLAEATYRFGFRGITAGDWLKDKLREEYRMKTESFRFSYDKKCYFPRQKQDHIPRVFFYARSSTPRRDFELGILTLNLLKKKMPELEIVFAGGTDNKYTIPFEYRDMGVITPQQLSEVYGQCDLCLIMSNTNLSLMPLEVMASNSVAVSSRGKHNEWLINDQNAVMVGYDPVEISKTMYDYLHQPAKLAEIRAKGIEFARSTSWDQEGEKVKNAIWKGIKEDEPAE